MHVGSLPALGCSIIMCLRSRHGCVDLSVHACSQMIMVVEVGALGQWQEQALGSFLDRIQHHAIPGSLSDAESALQETVHNIVREAVDLEHEFCCSALPVSLVGMNAELMGQYIKYVADRLLIELQCEKLYNTPNPFDWMEMISLQVRGTRTSCNSPCALYTMCSLMHISGTVRNAVVGMIGCSSLSIHTL